MFVHKRNTVVFEWRCAVAQLWLFETIFLDKIEQNQAILSNSYNVHHFILTYCLLNCCIHLISFGVLLLPSTNQSPLLLSAHQCPLLLSAHKSPFLPSAHKSSLLPIAHQSPLLPSAHKSPLLPRARSFRVPGPAMVTRAPCLALEDSRVSILE